MNQEETSRIRPGDSLIKFAACARDRFGHEPRWLWLKLEQDKAMPKPIYIGQSPHFISREIDEYLALCAAAPARQTRGEKIAA